MNDFFTFYSDIQDLKAPFMCFQLSHFIYITLSILFIIILYKHYCILDEQKRIHMQRKIAVYFLIEECIYTIWLLFFCHDRVWVQILPFELCSFCTYINVYSAFSQKEGSCFFSGVIGIFAGMAAMIYPMNISGLYPVFSYRTINFFMLHAAFVLFALMQLKNKNLLDYKHLKTNYLFLCLFFSIAFFTNMFLGTQYMFIGFPPSLPIMKDIYNLVGSYLFLPFVWLVLYFIQSIIFLFLRRIYHVKSIKHNFFLQRKN